MALWFRRSRPRAQAPMLRPRDAAVAALKIDLHELTPPADHFFGQCAALHLTFFEQLSHAAANAPLVTDKDALARAAGLMLDRYRALVARIDQHRLDRSATMQPHLAGVAEFERRVMGADWHEQVASAHVTIGFLTDFWLNLSAGLDRDDREAVEEALSNGSVEDTLHAIVERSIAANPRLASRLALWCRRLVGDTLLQARTALVMHDDHARDEAQIEPVFTELIGRHTRRMDRLGLTA
ncbi:MAG: ferritin-like fold-containing protein [Microcella sp.]